MITIKFLGGAKKSFSTDVITLQNDSMTISNLIKQLETMVQTGHQFDIENILIAVNGIDSSALQGKDTMIKDGDAVSIIPLIHGGSNKAQFQILKTDVMLIGIKKTNLDLIGMLDTLRKQHPKLVVQIIQENMTLGVNHIKKILQISIAAKNSDTMLSDILESDILLRFACTRQISDAIKKAGIQKNKNSILIIMGKKSEIKKVEKELTDLPKTNIKTHDSKFIKKQFGITKKELDSVISDTPLEDLLAERAAILFR